MVSDLFKVNRGRRCGCGGSCMGEGRLASIGVDLWVCNRWSIEIPEALAVVREVLIWCSMDPLDLG